MKGRIKREGFTVQRVHAVVAHRAAFNWKLFVAIGYECTVECSTTCSLYATVQEGTYRIAIASTGNCVCLHVTSIYSRYRRNCSL